MTDVMMTSEILIIRLTRNSAGIAEKPRDAFRGQSRSPNMAPFHFLLVSYSNFVRKMHRFWDIRFQKCRDLENRVKGPWRSCRYWDIQYR